MGRRSAGRCRHIAQYQKLVRGGQDLGMIGGRKQGGSWPGTDRRAIESRTTNPVVHKITIGLRRVNVKNIELFQLQT